MRAPHRILRFEFVYRVLPVPVLYTRWFVGWRGALTVWLVVPVVLIHPRYRADRGLLAHELAHARQSYRLYLLNSLLYRSSSWYRYQCELEAYRAQLRYSPGSEKEYANALASQYELDVPVERALEDLKRRAG